MNGVTMPRILVIGDVFLDRDTWLQSIRTSGEGVPVVWHVAEDVRLGGAGAVAAMAAGLGAEVLLLGVSGDTSEPHFEVVDALRSAGIDYRCVDGTATKIKNRVFVDHKQLYRRDIEDVIPITNTQAKAICTDLPDVDVVLVSDYGKGVVTRESLHWIFARFKGRAPVIVDPAPRRNWMLYQSATCLTPNRSEARGMDVADLYASTGVTSIVRKLDRDGMDLVIASGGTTMHFPSRCPPDKLIDVCGAGDMVLAALGFSVAQGRSWGSAADFANRAAGAKCMKLGAVPLTIQEIDRLCPLQPQSA